MAWIFVKYGHYKALPEKAIAGEQIPARTGFAGNRWEYPGKSIHGAPGSCLQNGRVPAPEGLGREQPGMAEHIRSRTDFFGKDCGIFCTL